METPRPQPTYEERLSQWRKDNSIERRPLTDRMREGFEQRLQEGRIRATRNADGSVLLEQAYSFREDLKLYTPIDLEHAVVKADGEMQLSDSPIAPAYLQWLREVEGRVKAAPKNP